MSAFDSWRQQPPAIYQSVRSQTEAEYRITIDRIRMLPITLEPTSEPVWPEDEAREEEALRAAGRMVPALAAEADAQELTVHVRAKLPDRLQGCVLRLPRSAHLPTVGFDYYLIAVPTTFATTLEASGITPRRLALELTLRDARSAESERIPVACYLYPGAEAATEITNVGKFEIDLGKAVQVIWPGFPDLLTAKTGGSFDIKKVRARVQATGKDSQECGWLIADSEIAYDFNPSCIVQAPKGTRLSIEARLRVEVWKRVAVAFHKAYLIQAKPMRYVLASSDSLDSLEMGSEVTLDSPLRQPSYYNVKLSAPPSEVSPEAGVTVETNTFSDMPTVDADGYWGDNALTASHENINPRIMGHRLLSDDAVVSPAAPGSDQSSPGISSGVLALTPGYAVVCRRGHVEGSPAKPSPDRPGFCPECGAQLLGRCAACHSGISLNAGQPPKFCTDCGTPFPWVTRPERFYALENMLGREEVDEATQLLVQDDLQALRASSDLDEKQQLEIWKRIRARAPSLFSGPCLEISKTLLTPYLEEGLGLAASR